MKKLILKTIAITIGAVFLFVLIVYGVFALFFPTKTAKFYDGLGAYKTAARYMEKAYKKTGDIKDLDETCLYALKTDDNGLIASYLGELFGDKKDDFAEYAKTKTYNAADDYFDFMAGRYVSAMYNSGVEKNTVVTEAFRLTVTYKKQCAARSLLVESVSSKDTDTVTEIRSKLEEKSSVASEAEAEIIENDIDMIDLFLKK